MDKVSVTERVLSYIEEHLGQELSLEGIAEELHYSKYYMARAFREKTGITLHKYIQGRRLSEAARKLAQTRQPILDNRHSPRHFTKNTDVRPGNTDVWGSIFPGRNGSDFR